ncbi:MAG: hypothetical protein ACYCSB_03930 [bacterium]
MRVKELKEKFGKNLKAKILNGDLIILVQVIFTLSFLAAVFGILSYITADGKGTRFIPSMPMSVLRADIVIDTLWCAGSLCIIGVLLLIIDRAYRKDRECILCKDYELESCPGTEQDRYEGGYNCERFNELKTATHIATGISNISEIIKNIDLKVKEMRRDIKTISVLSYISVGIIVLSAIIILLLR